MRNPPQEPNSATMRPFPVVNQVTLPTCAPTRNSRYESKDKTAVHDLHNNKEQTNPKETPNYKREPVLARTPQKRTLQYRTALPLCFQSDLPTLNLNRKWKQENNQALKRSHHGTCVSTQYKKAMGGRNRESSTNLQTITPHKCQTYSYTYTLNNCCPQQC